MELAGVAPLLPKSGEIGRSHKVQLYSNDEVFLDTFTRFIVAALKAGDAVIVAVTESHRDNLFQRVQAHGLDVAAVVEQGRYIPLDVAAMLSTFMVDDFPDQVRFLEAASALVVTANSGYYPRVLS